MERRVVAAGLWVLFIAGCGVPGPAPERSTSVRQALASSPEMLEAEPLALRQSLFREVARAAQSDSAGSAGLTLFPVIQSGQLHAGSAWAPDLFQVPDAGAPAALTFADDGAERWPDDRREALQGLSEREAAELVARTLLNAWSIHASAPTRVDRAVGAPYAVAYADGVLRVNPSFLYLAASIGLSPGSASER